MIDIQAHGGPFGGGGAKGLITQTNQAITNAMRSSASDTADVIYNNDGGYAQYSVSGATVSKTIYNAGGTQISSATVQLDVGDSGNYLYAPTPNEIYVVSSGTGFYVYSFDSSLTRLSKTTRNSAFIPAAKFKDNSGVDHWAGFVDFGVNVAIYNAGGTELARGSFTSGNNHKTAAKVTSRLVVLTTATNMGIGVCFFEGTTARVVSSTEGNGAINFIKSFGRR